MRVFNLLFLGIILLSLNVSSLIYSQKVSSPVISDFTGIHQFLSSDWMEGREAGEKGSFMAADYISSMMQLFKLEPYLENNKSYFQDFQLIGYMCEKSSLTLFNNSLSKSNKTQFEEGLDFKVSGFPKSIEIESSIVFAGYGISSPELGFDEYKAIDARGKTVLLIKGFPGNKDTASIGWVKLSKAFGDEDMAHEAKLLAAKKHGAIALIEINTDSKCGLMQPLNIDLLKSTMNSDKNTEPEYKDDEFILPDDISEISIPYIIIGSDCGKQILAETGITITDFEKKSAQALVPSSSLIKDKTIVFSIQITKKPILVRNLIGMIPGLDKSKNIIVGAHYDHLGMRDGQIYNGADDNASGTAGLLALAKNWSESNIKPPCNIIFASWSGEEKGLHGSRYFAQNLNLSPKDILLYLNMDMISRSAPEDTGKRQLSIGTRTADKQLREMASKINSSLVSPFILDLWDVTGHYGSDYASFRDKNIPVMTFFSGFHDDYHTPRDISIKVDNSKMEAILMLVNECLKQFIENVHELN